MEIKNNNKKYWHEPRIVYSCQYHVIFTPKFRRKVLNEEIQESFKNILKSLAKELEFNIIEVEVMSDHVHLLLDVNPKTGIYSIVSKIKGRTSNILRKQFPELKKKLPCLWNGSKFISSVGSVNLDVVKQYIESQKND